MKMSILVVVLGIARPGTDVLTCTAGTTWILPAPSFQ